MPPSPLHPFTASPMPASPLHRFTPSPLHRFLLLTIDVEDWFQVENLKSRIPFSSWDSQELRVERNTHRLLDLLDSIPCAALNSRSSNDTRAFHHPIEHPHPFQNGGATSQANPPFPKGGTTSRRDPPFPKGGRGDFATPKATFFILGWIAQRLPHLVTEIHRRGHEVASHGYHHELCYNLDPAVLKDDLTRSRHLLEDLTGTPVHGYRAPNFSISDDILKLIEDCGYQYDSSYNSFSGNGRYGKVNLTAPPHPTVAHKLSKSFYELPISNINVGRHTLPLGGGGYFRLAPLPLFLFGIKRLLSRQDGCILYFHPWEIDPDQPQVDGLPPSHRFRHHVNLDKTQDRLLKLLTALRHCFFPTCRQYLAHMTSETFDEARQAR